jgi:predicted DNA-binding protein
MMNQKRSLLDRLASGELTLPSESEVKADPNYDDGIEATIRFMEETRAAALAEPRKAGRPLKIAARRITSVRGLRLEDSLWGDLETISEDLGSSVNRYIEEAILMRIESFELKNDNYELMLVGNMQNGSLYTQQDAWGPGKIVDFQLNSAA